MLPTTVFSCADGENSPPEGAAFAPTFSLVAGDFSMYCGRLITSTWSESDPKHHKIVFALSPHRCEMTHRSNHTGLAPLPIRAGCLYFIPARTEYAMTWGDGILTIINLHDNDKSHGLSAIREVRSESPGHRSHHGAMFNSLANLFHVWSEYQTAGYERLAVESVRTIVNIAKSLMLSKPARVGKRHEQLTSGQLRTIETYMMENPRINADIAALARLIHISPSQFMRLFKNTMHVSAMSHYRQIRMQKAKEMLESGEHSIAGVVSELGFCSQSMLTNHCQRYLHDTPKRILNRGIRNRVRAPAQP